MELKIVSPQENGFVEEIKWNNEELKAEIASKMKKSIEKGKEVPVKEDDHCMDAIRYCVMGAWKRLKYWLPKDETEEIDVCDISRKEVEDDEYL